MPGILDPAVEKYLSNILPARDAVLADMERYAKEHNIAIIGPECGRSAFAHGADFRSEAHLRDGIGDRIFRYLVRTRNRIRHRDFLYRRRSGQCRTCPQKLRPGWRGRSYSIHDRRSCGPN